MTTAFFKHLIPVSLLCMVFVACSSPAPTPTQPTSARSKQNRKAVYILAVDLKAHTITVDPIEFLTGAAALKAYQQDNPGATFVPDDYDIVNKKKEHVVLPLAKKAIVKLAGGSTGSQKGTFAPTKLVGYRGVGNQRFQPFWITTHDGTVIEVDEQFVP